VNRIHFAHLAALLLALAPPRLNGQEGAPANVEPPEAESSVGREPSAATAAAAKPIDLRPRFVEGRKLRYALEQTMLVNVGGVEQGGALRTVCALETKKSTSEGGATVTLTYEAAGLTVNAGKRRFGYDTRQPDAPDSDKNLARLLEAFVGRSLDLRYLPSGEVRAIDGLDEIFAGPEGASLRTFLQEDALRVSFAKLVTPSPGKEGAAVGETWSDRERSSFDETTTLVVDYEYVVREARDDLVRIEFSGKLRLEPKKGIDEPLEYKLEAQEAKGEVHWDPKERVVLRHSLDLQIALRGPLADGTVGVIRYDQRSRVSLEK